MCRVIIMEGLILIQFFEETRCINKHLRPLFLQFRRVHHVKVYVIGGSFIVTFNSFGVSCCNHPVYQRTSPFRIDLQHEKLSSKVEKCAIFLLLYDRIPMFILRDYFNKITLSLRMENQNEISEQPSAVWRLCPKW